MHRQQNDPKIYDDDSSSMVFQELAPSRSDKAKNRGDLESELFGESEDRKIFSHLRDNEGEAAEYGVYFDDSEYNYMQHMRDLNSESGEGESFFVEAPVMRKERKGKGRAKLEDALRDASLEDRAHDDVPTKCGSRLLENDILPSKSLRKSTYQDQQNVPDALAGFQPDMDPRLREVLEALDDEAYVEDEDDIFGELTKGGTEVSLAEFEELGINLEDGKAEDDGWETDDTAKPAKEYRNSSLSRSPDTTDVYMKDGVDQGDGNWMKEYSKFKKAENSKANKPQVSNPEVQSSILTGTSMTGGRRKRRKGAMTSSTGYSMTSSSLLRTEGLTLLDACFDKIEEDYADEDMEDEDGSVSVMTGSSINSGQALALRSDFDSIMDEFLDGYSMSGRKRIKKGKNQSGMEQLDEIRKGLGLAKLRV